MDFLRGAGLVTGPSSALTRHSWLSEVKHTLFGNPVNKQRGKKDYHTFGTVLHEKFLLGKQVSKGLKISTADKRRINFMLKSLNRHSVVKVLMKDTVREQQRVISLRGIIFSYTPDAKHNGKKLGLDLKTTVCDSVTELIQKAFEYGYFRQGATYSEAEDFEDFFIIGIQKNPPFQVFIIHINEHLEKYNYAKQELDFLLYFTKNYGTFKELAEVHRESKEDSKLRREYEKKISSPLKKAK